MKLAETGSNISHCSVLNMILVFMLVISLLHINKAFEINENLILAYSKGFKNTTNSLYVLKWATGITTAKGTKSIYFYFK